VSLPEFESRSSHIQAYRFTATSFTSVHPMYLSVDLPDFMSNSISFLKIVFYVIRVNNMATAEYYRPLMLWREINGYQQ
jgi:hypothetical protein